MRWKPGKYHIENGHWIHWLWIWPFAIALLPIGLMVVIDEAKTKWIGPSSQWRPWFAWHPVRLTWSYERVWLEWVERRRGWCDTEIRLREEAKPSEVTRC